MARALKIVATPIGNIRDISLRAMDALKKADVILAEDTRHSLQLIQALNIELKPECRLISCDSHKETDRIKVVEERLLANDQVVLIADAGCPTISGPGSLLVQGIVLFGLSVEVIPGPSALTAALMGAGIDTTRFAFLGFLPQKKSQRQELIKAVARAGLSLVMYEAPQRVEALLTDLHDILGKRRVVIARELTKLYETFHRGHLGEPLNPPFTEKGECVVIVEAGDFSEKPDQDAEEERENFIKAELAKGVSAKDLARIIAAKYAMKKTAAYDLVLKIGTMTSYSGTQKSFYTLACGKAGRK
jgi:16S rRNA (cytidine1402-2'-O)-methyltransferase